MDKNPHKWSFFAVSESSKHFHPEHFEWPQLGQVMQPSTMRMPYSPQAGQAGPVGLAAPIAVTLARGSSFNPIPSPSMKPIAIRCFSITPPIAARMDGTYLPAHPRAAARVEDGLQFLDHEADIAAAPEHRRDHPGQRHGPGEMLHVLGIDEDLERAPLPADDDIVDGDVDRVVGLRAISACRSGPPARPAGPAVRHIDHVAIADRAVRWPVFPRFPRRSARCRSRRWAGRWCSPCSRYPRPACRRS